MGTLEGPGLVKDTKILTQLVLVQLEHDNSEIAVPLEELLDPETCPRPGETARRLAEEAAIDPLRGMDEDEVRRRTGQEESGGGKKKRQRRRRKKQKDQGREGDSTPAASSGDDTGGKSPRKKRRRRRRRRKGGGGSKGSKSAE